MKNKFYMLLLVSGIGLMSCVEGELQREYTDSVNVFIGTGGHGHTFPGATLPHGMVQLSPDTRLIGWDACSGYYYDDTSIIGFSHTHLSGTCYMLVESFPIHTMLKMVLCTVLLLSVTWGFVYVVRKLGRIGKWIMG